VPGSIGDIADPLRAAGLAVTELPGWRTRGESDGGFSPIGVIWHHDGMGLGFDGDPSNDDNVAEFMSQNGNNGAQIWIRKDGNVHLLASGRKWHAGIGRGFGDIPANDGNTFAVGIETDHTFGNPWPQELVDAIVATSAVLGNQYGWSTSNMCGHKEYAPDRKPDPEGVDCNEWRRLTGVKKIQLLGPAPTPTPKPDPDQEDDMPLSSDDVKRIADEVMKRLTSQPVVTMEKYDDKDKPYTEQVSVTRALQSTQVQGIRTAKKVGAA
jgi:hypothetical protein